MPNGLHRKKKCKCGQNTWRKNLSKLLKYGRNVDRSNRWEGITCMKVPEARENEAYVRYRGEIIMDEEIDNIDSLWWRFCMNGVRVGKMGS